MSIDHAFVLLSVLIAFTAFNIKREYFLISMILVADFCFFFGFDEIWINTGYIDLNQDLVFILKGFAYLTFFYLYLIGGSVYLAALSVLAGFYHFSVPSVGVGHYTAIMTLYCIMQLIGAGMGVAYDAIHRDYPHLFGPLDYIHGYKRKNQGHK